MPQYNSNQVTDAKIYTTPQGDRLVIPDNADPENTDFEGCTAAYLEYNGDTWAIFTGEIYSYDKYDVTELRTTKSGVKEALKAAEGYLFG